jgi:thymidylate kinase
MNAFETTNDGENIVILDGTLSIEDLHEEIWKKVKEMTF